MPKCVNKNTLVILCSYSGETEEIIKLLNPFKNLDVKIIALTSKNNSTLSKSSDISLDVSIDTSVKLSKILNSHQNPLICESGIHSTDNIKFIIDNTGIYNFLIGESLLKSQDIGSKLKEFTQITL